MATESPLLHDGSQNVSQSDLRNSAITGTTLSGPNGSGQFLALTNSTSVDRTLKICTAAGVDIYGICQNKPALGEAIDAGIFGVSKAVAGAAIAPGQDLMTSSTALGTLIPYSSGAGVARCGRALEAAVVGQVFTAAIYGLGAGSGSVA